MSYTHTPNGQCSVSGCYQQALPNHSFCASHNTSGHDSSKKNKDKDKKINKKDLKTIGKAIVKTIKLALKITNAVNEIQENNE
ncbi:hypothetical protein PPL_12458 [Heterostelium album PN500]|uniref:Uncharacterized protein n=1 Tax=Heterostelium pallidum (strain ATCC 26659 / Pp 5 / PN500) TaxID=670386 RepID=D3BMN5_HETP5|nr:hypothetical protein PPL_12458 [Heterostelium album PN500]EFA77247.1 hypothetical protein PPL_12458 [Heterostelium album PN500]|eukprot:XP_020429376.1 hypothetical protein PPL_12458 [Heterostelium album PN500]